MTVHDYADERTYTETFDYVVVASGHFSTPRIPEYPGFEKFGGRILHAHDFRDALEFKNKNVLIVGSSYSAEDIGSQCYKYGAKNIISCYRSAPMGYKWPENWSERPQLTHVNQTHAYFQDGSSVAVDAIILCTGYLHHFPFIESSLSLRTNNILYPLNLYQGVVWEQNPKLFYLGMQDQWYSFNMFDAQAWFARDVMLGRIELPSLQEMQIDTLAWHNAEKSLEDVHAMYKFQGDYIMRLIEQTDYPTFDIEGVRKTFMAWKKHKKENIMTFRDHTYCSLMTGTQASPHHTTWLEALDDSLDAYLHVGSTVKQKVG